MKRSNKKRLFFEEIKGSEAVFGRNFLSSDNVFLKNMQERYPIEDFTGKEPIEIKKEDGIKVSDSLFLVGDCDNTHKSFIRIPLYNTNHGNIEGRIFKSSIKDIDELIKSINSIEVGDIIGKYNEYPKGSGNFSINVTSIISTDESKDLFLPVIKDDNIVDIRDEFIFYLSKLDTKYLEFVTTILDDAWGLYSIAPASKKNHHDYIGGLLQHTVEVVRIAYKLSILSNVSKEEFIFFMNKINRIFLKLDWNKYMSDWSKETEVYNSRERRYVDNFTDFVPMITEMTDKIVRSFVGKRENEDSIDLNKVITGILLHDIGKIIEYKYPKDKELDKYQLFFGKSIDYVEGNDISMDTIGKRLGHIVAGELLCQKYFISKEFELDFTDYIDILSIISTHHLKEDWGSPTKAETSDELIVHLSDNIDAKISKDI